MFQIPARLRLRFAIDKWTNFGGLSNCPTRHLKETTYEGPRSSCKCKPAGRSRPENGGIVLRIPHKFAHLPTAFDRVTARWTRRYGVAVVVVGLQVALNLLFGRVMGEFYLVPFVTVLLASVLGGLGPDC